MASNRYEDTYRHPPLYEQLVRQGRKEGDLSKDATPEQVEAYFDTLRAKGKLQGSVPGLIGDDLTDKMLDDLWALFAGTGESVCTYTGSWWADKPHQIAYRLLLRLTRAEAELAEVRAKVGP